MVGRGGQIRPEWISQVNAQRHTRVASLRGGSGAVAVVSARLLPSPFSSPKVAIHSLRIYTNAKISAERSRVLGGVAGGPNGGGEKDAGIRVCRHHEEAARGEGTVLSSQ